MSMVSKDYLSNRGVGEEVDLGVIYDDTSRYHRMKRLRDPFTGFTTIRMYRRSYSIYEVPKKYYKVDTVTEFRPDLLAAKVYNNVHLWWRIFEANFIRGIEELREGITLEIPDNSDITVHFAVRSEEIFA